MMALHRTDQRQTLLAPNHKSRRALFSLLMACVLLPSACAQSVQSPSESQTVGDKQLSDIEHRITDLTSTLEQTQAALMRSQAELVQLRAELAALRGGKAATPADTMTVLAADVSTKEDIQSVKEQEEILQAEVKQHDQTKVESASKYGLTVTGIALFNAYSNAGVVDDTELPSLAYPRSPGASHGSLGATLRQTVLGVAATGPVIAGAQTTAAINVDFFGGSETGSFGYTTPDGYVRMRDGEVALAWNRSKLRAGYFGPLVSPLSPTSFATVAQPALSASGNLWTWSPQVSFEQTLSIHEQRGITLEGGLISPSSPAYTSTQLDSPIEASRRPGVEGRIAYHSDTSTTSTPRSFVLGVGAYTASQSYNSTTHIHSWAVTGDWEIPVSRWLDLSGEVYRGRALGGLGGGLYKDIFSGTDPTSGVARSVGVEAAGGWTQLKLSPTPRWEANAMFGLDDAYASSFRSVILPAGSAPITLTARNSTVSGNLIFRPLASVIFSPEYRRVLTWRYSGGPYVANIFTLSAGYKF
jgi:hypothetical protein